MRINEKSFSVAQIENKKCVLGHKYQTKDWNLVKISVP
jgi:hypothetical protein